MVDDLSISDIEKYQSMEAVGIDASKIMCSSLNFLELQKMNQLAFEFKEIAEHLKLRATPIIGEFHKTAPRNSILGMVQGKDYVSDEQRAERLTVIAAELLQLLKSKESAQARLEELKIQLMSSFGEMGITGFIKSQKLK